MKIVRPITPNDLPAFEEFAFRSTTGIINLPKDHQLLYERIRDSVMTFAETNRDPYRHMYVFVMEDLETGQLGGTSAIRARTGGIEPIYFYKIIDIPSRGDNPRIPVQKAIQGASEEEGPSNICALYLIPEFRKGGLGRLMSLSRFLFMASHPQHFTETVTSELRGVIDESGRSPFWDAIGKHFFEAELPETFNLLMQGKQFIADFLPQYPIYINVIPFEAQKAIGAVKSSTQPALKMLLDEGFTLQQTIDVFDGGPNVIANLKEIRTIKESVVAMVAHLTDEHVDSDDYIISNTVPEFRSCFGTLTLDSDKATLSKKIAAALKLELGHTIRFAPVPRRKPA